MASFPKDKRSYPYYRIVFRKKYAQPVGAKNKTFYFRKDEFKRSEVSDWKKRRELEFKDGRWLPWDKAGRITKTKRLTITEAIATYAPIARRKLADSTATTRLSYLQQFAEFVGANRTLSNIPDLLVEEWVNGDDIMYNTRRKRQTCVNQLYKHLRDREKAIDRLPSFEILSTKAERMAAKKKQFKTWLHHAELAGLLAELETLHREIAAKKQAHSRYAQKYESLRPKLKDVFRIVHKTGMRLADIQGFDLRWIRDSPNLPGKRIIHFGATGSAPKSQNLNEAIPVMPEIDDIIDRLLAEGTRQPFGAMSKDWISKTFKKCMRRAYPQKAQRMSFHNLRDSAANYWLYERNLPVKIVQQILRHKDIETTMIYVHNDLAEVEKHIHNAE